MTKPRVLSGVQPTGNLHLGNYLGAIRNWVKLQDSHECLFMLADLHAITVPQNPANLTRNTRETAAAYIACGIDPTKSAIFPQSAVTMHAELAWILNCHTPLGWLNRMTQFKEKANTVDETMLTDIIIQSVSIAQNNAMSHPSDKIATAGTVNVTEVAKAVSKNLKKSFANRDAAALGLYAYPVLMAADILGYHATHVPVGEDQKQHLELARDIAGAFNRAYKEEFFPLPEPLIMPTAARIMSLTDGTKKMSKSDVSAYSRLTLMDDADTIAKKIRKAQADSISGITYDPANRPAVANLLTIFAALTDRTPEAVAEEFSSAQNSTFKAALAEVAVATLSPITTRMRELMADTTTLDALLHDGAERARAIASPILAQTMQCVGFLRV